MKPYHIVFTTIYHPNVLTDLFENLAKFGHLNTTKVWVVGDKKTPKSCGELALEVTQKGLETTYLDISAQDNWGRKIPDFYQRIPYNNETRRNIGYLSALEDDCEIMISMDDDNFPTDHDFVGGHRQTGKSWDQGVISEKSGFHNICEYLRMEPERSVYPRGFPFRLRGVNNRSTIENNPHTIIGVTAGMWLNDPDIDATTWLNGKVTGVDYTGQQTQVLSQTTWSPVNPQNPSVIRDLIPAFLCIPMGWDVPGGNIQRYGDIWGGYILQAVMKGSNFHVAFGYPLVNHNRNPHDYVDDLRFEYWGMILTDWLTDQLRSFEATSNDIIERVEELVDYFEDSIIPDLPDWCPDAVEKFMHWTSGNLLHWAASCRTFI